MLGFISYVLRSMMDVSMELLIYMFVDVFTKNTLRETSEVSEKRSIWLCEVAVLTILGSAVLLLHHTPYVLSALTVLTLAYTQLLERVNFRYWWVSLGTKWDEFQQHEESMGRLTRMSHQQSMQQSMQQQGYVTPNGRWGVSPPQPQMPPQMPPTYVPYDSSMVQSEAWYPADANKRPGMVMLNEVPGTTYSYTVSPSRPRPPPPGMGMPPHAGYGRLPPEYGMHQAAPTPPTYTYSATLPSTVHNLARPPLHPHLGSPAGMAASKALQPPSIKTRVMSALGMKTQSTVPAGLRNNGENLCFMNSVLQCLAHCSGLAHALSHNEEAPDCTPAQIALVTSVTDLMGALGSAPTMTPVVGADRVQQAASTLPGTMVSHPKHPQQQQDAAEFLMWLLDALHSALDVSTRRNQQLKNQPQPMSWITARCSSGALNMLRFIYGDLTPEKIRELKAACRKEIEMAGGVDVRGYAEAVQRLSDLEWLTYKETAQSVIDDIFTGQIVEALHCTACYRLTVDIQTFNILPVPITQPRAINGLVRLEDCLTTFGTVEELYGPEGLQCECCNHNTESEPGATASNNVQRSMHGLGPLGASPILPNGVTRIRIGDTVRRRKLGSDSAIYSPMGSPIGVPPGPRVGEHVFNDSGFQDHGAMRTSTPIGIPGNVPVKLTDGQRRSLLRQVPECLILQLLRFTYAGGQPIKLHQPVVLPLQGLDLTPQIVDTVIQRPDMTSQTASHRYDLCGLCLHLGADVTASGHYVSYGRTSDGEWYRHDDDHVVAVNMDYELSTRQVRENAYLAFYRRTSHS